MEQKGLLLSALGVGVGVGMGLGLASGQSSWTGGSSAASIGPNLEDMEKELIRQIVDGRESPVRFDEFPYYLSEQTRALLTSAAYVHLRHADVSKYTRNLAPASKAILLSGPSELYQQMLARALAHYFESKLLLLDVTDFSLKIQNKYGTSKESCFKRSSSESTLELLSGLFSSFSLLPQEQPTGTLKRQSSGADLVARRNESLPKLRRNASASDNINALASHSSPANPAAASRTSGLFFDEKLLIQALYKVLVFVSKAAPIVLYLRDVDKLLFRSQRFYNFFQQMLKKLSGNVLILGSRVVDLGNENQELDERLHILFPYNIEIRPPDDERHLVNWKYLLEKDMNMIQTQDSKNHIMEVLWANDLDFDDLNSICVADTVALSRYIEEVVVSAISYHLMNNKDSEYRNGKLIISSKSLSYGLNLFQGKFGGDKLKLEPQTERSKEVAKFSAVMKPESKSRTGTGTTTTSTTTITNPEKIDIEISALAVKVPEVVPDNEFEKRIRPEVIPPNEINVTFADIGAMDDTKESLQELVMLPLRRPDLFKGGLLKPCRGILLFGPPGTGKTMLAKAIAREAGASFINVSMSTIASKWFGEDEKNVRALFTLAAKVSPTIIFVV
ncbi:uncharacterized protein LOC120206584 [Hibiscus syriacus]|uniref:uncharacterized protein LOC120206584 n=1 Tax=Hibiscus syriacus TaxID=106335 RepID=UPI0019208A60|nr:uncharacterized protein LOC120206584 [Hibiscus syriacus]